jgi:hypothetical protein
MSKTPFEQTQQLNEDDILAEYDFDYRLAKPNRFVPEDEEQRLKVIILDEDVAKVFKTSESVNEVLRAFIESIPS